MMVPSAYSSQFDGRAEQILGSVGGPRGDRMILQSHETVVIPNRTEDDTYVQVVSFRSESIAFMRVGVLWITTRTARVPPYT